MRPSFNLVEEPWIPCLFPDRPPRELGLFDVLVQAREIQEIYDISPLVVIALHRLLLAILHRNVGPETLHDWKELWQRGRWGEAELRQYFDRWQHRFYLFHPERPFYQVPTMENATEHPVQKLVEEAAWGNNPTLFDHNYRACCIPMFPSQAARYVVAYQAFAVAGLAGPKQVNFSDAPLTRGYSVMIFGDNLFETLALNLLPTPWDAKNDKPIWEQDAPARFDRGGTYPHGLADYFTWQSRHLHLIRGQDNGVTNCQIVQNLRLPEGFHHDPFKCYRKDEQRQMLLPLKINPERALWRDSHTLFQKAGSLPGKGGSSQRPEVFNWLARTQSILPHRNFRFSITGLAADQAKVFLWRHESLPLPLDYLEDNQELLGTLITAIKLTEEVSQILNACLYQIAQLLLSPGYDPKNKNSRKPDPQAVKNLLKSWAPDRLYFSQLEAPFRELLVSLPEDWQKDEDGDLEYGGTELLQWGRALKLSAYGAFDTIGAGLGDSPRALKAMARVEVRFRAALDQEIRKLSPGGEHEAEE
jgi:CRISPR system Cascade subunit CasA